MTGCVISHKREYRIRFELSADKRAFGGAVTVAPLWTLGPQGTVPLAAFFDKFFRCDGYHRLTIEFDAHDDELNTVSAKLGSEDGVTDT